MWFSRDCEGGQPRGSRPQGGPQGARARFRLGDPDGLPRRTPGGIHRSRRERTRAEASRRPGAGWWRGWRRAGSSPGWGGGLAAGRFANQTTSRRHGARSQVRQRRKRWDACTLQGPRGVRREEVLTRRASRLGLTHTAGLAGQAGQLLLGPIRATDAADWRKPPTSSAAGASWRSLASRRPTCALQLPPAPGRPA